VVRLADSEDPASRLAAYQREATELHGQIRTLEEEVNTLRKRLQDGPKRVRTLEEKLLETKGQLQQAISQNEKLTYTLREAREHIASLREEVDKLTQPPSAYGTFLGTNDDGSVDVFAGGRKMRVALHPEFTEAKLQRGQEVVLNESLNVVLARGSESSGEVVTMKEILDGGLRAIVVGRADEERVVELTDTLRRSHESGKEKLRAGDSILMDARTGLLLEKLPRPEVEELVLEEVPDISYADVGGLDSQIEAITDAVELPFLHRELFLEHKLPAPRASCCTAPPAAARPSSPRRWPTRSPRRSPRPGARAAATPSRSSSTSRVPSC
jgi:proteasome-associated ATPase